MGEPGIGIPFTLRSICKDNALHELASACLHVHTACVMHLLACMHICASDSCALGGGGKSSRKLPIRLSANCGCVRLGHSVLVMSLIQRLIQRIQGPKATLHRNFHPGKRVSGEVAQRKDPIIDSHLSTAHCLIMANNMSWLGVLETKQTDAAHKTEEISSAPDT